MNPENPEPRPVRCGLVMPIAAFDNYTEAHWVDVQNILKEALSPTGFTIDLVSDSVDSGVIQKRIVQNLHDFDIIVCDVSGRNPNVMFELGMRLAFDKPAVIVKDNISKYSFDTAVIEHLPYPADLHYPSITAFKARLRQKVEATLEAAKQPGYTTFLKHFGQFKVAELDEKTVNASEFIMEELESLRRDIRTLVRPARNEEDSLANKIFSTPINSSDRRTAVRFIQNHLNDYSVSDYKKIDSPAYNALVDYTLTALHLPTANQLLRNAVGLKTLALLEQTDFDNIALVPPVD
jgi:hypothetical protein